MEFSVVFVDELPHNRRLADVYRATFAVVLLVRRYQKVLIFELQWIREDSREVLFQRLLL